MFGATRLSVVLVLSVFAISRAMADPQIIAGIEIDYPVAFERLKPGAEEFRQRIAIRPLAHTSQFGGDP